MNWHFEWDDQKASDNFRSHGVSFEEAQEAFGDLRGLDEFDAVHSEDETCYNLIALSSRRLLMVVYAEGVGGGIRLISARRADGRERKKYESC